MLGSCGFAPCCRRGMEGGEEAIKLLVKSNVKAVLESANIGIAAFKALISVERIMRTLKGQRLNKSQSLHPSHLVDFTPFCHIVSA